MFKYKINDQDQKYKPGFDILDVILCCLNELNSCDINYIIEEVLPNLTKVMSGELTEYEFGYDATIIDFGKDKSVINYNYFEDKIEIFSEDLYRFMCEWGDYLIRWKQNTKSQDQQLGNLSFSDKGIYNGEDNTNREMITTK